MEPSLSTRGRVEVRAWAEGSTASARPLVRPAPRSAMFFPLAVLVAVLPGLYGLTRWELNPPGPWWGLRALAVVDGRVFDQVPPPPTTIPGPEAQALRAVAWQPPLYAWLAALGLLASPDRDPWAAVLPSYVAGAALVLLAYLHGRAWRGPGVGLVAAILTGSSPRLLEAMKGATPTTLAVAGASAFLYCQGRHIRVGSGPARWLGPGGVLGWAALGGLALGVSLGSLAGFGLACLPVLALHQAYLQAGPPSGGRRKSRFAWRDHPGPVAALVSGAIALALVAPWHALMARRYGFEAIAAVLWPPDRGETAGLGLAARLVELAPATLVLGLFAAARAAHRALTAEDDDRATVGGVLWVAWLAAAALLPSCWPDGPSSAMDLFLMLPLNLLAAQGIVDLAGRQAAVRTLTWLAPATAVSIAWWAAASLRDAVTHLLSGRANSATALGLHLALDLLIVSMVAIRVLDRWARRRDDRQRRVLAGFFAAVFTTAIAAGVCEVQFRHRETGDLLALREIVLRRHRVEPFRWMAVVGPDPSLDEVDGPIPGGRLRFILQAALPGLPRFDLASANDLLGLPEGRRLVILAGTGRRLGYAVQARLNLEAIHPGRSGVLDAFATALPPLDERRPVVR